MIGRASVGLLRNHDATSEQEPVKGHGLRVVFLLRPGSSQVRPKVVRPTKARPSNEADVIMLMNRAVGPKNWHVKSS